MNHNQKLSKMKKLVLSLAIIILTVSTVIGQDTEIKSLKSTHLNFGFNIGAPLGKTTSDLVEFVLGGDLQLAYQASEKFYLTASAGFDVWHGKKAKNSNYVPLLGGLRLYISDKVYFSEQAGYAIGVSKDATTGAKIKGAFTNVAGIGVNLGQISDILLCYKGLFHSGANQNVIALRVSYNFGK